MEVQPLTVGPIVGETTASSVRLWGRGGLELIQSGPRRCFGVARIRAANARFSAPKFFIMNPNFDMTGIVYFDELDPETRYIYQIGWFFSDLELDELGGDRSPSWDRAHTYEFTTASEDPAGSRSFVFGSCRYLLKMFGGNWFDKRGDKTFRTILEQIQAGTRTDQVIMLGDQIYADDLSFVHPDEALDEYYARYRDVFSRPHIGRLMSHVPTYMTLDDHEIEDGWPANSTDRDWMVKYPSAIHAYQTYQLSHSPLFSISNDRLVGVPVSAWYTFRDGCCDFFVTDTRTERFLADTKVASEIISQEQMEALKQWLSDGSGRVKLIVSAVPVFPETKLNNDDKWGGFPTQRSELLDFIRENDIRRVVFLSGDVHSSLSAELVSPGAPDFKIIAAISSPFYWPYPHNPRRYFNLYGQIESNLSDAVYQVTNAGRVVSTDNFTRVTADLEGLVVEVYARKGELLAFSRHTF